MANSLSKSWICALALVSTALAAQNGGRGSGEVKLDMKSFEIDNKTNLINLHGPMSITQGEMTIAADEAVATGMDFQAKSEWTFKGHVRITLDSAVVTSDVAVFTFDDKALASGELAGDATFEATQPGGKEPARGGANKIVYDYSGRTLRLTEHAWFQSSGVQAEGCDLVYNLNTERVTSGSADCSDRFRIRFLPKQGENAAGADPPR